jgi:concanavalin A-like lectin/glucanase superfamily protein/PEP-CTERM motif-containing protein
MRSSGRFLIGCAAGLFLFASTSRADLIFHNRLESPTAPSQVGPNGTPNGAPTAVPGKIGNAVNLRGGMAGTADDDNIRYGAIPNFNTTGARTISGWVNANSNTTPDWSTTFGFTDNQPTGANNSGHFFDVTTQTDAGSTARYRPHQWGSEQVLQINGQDTLDAGNWHHIAVTYDPGTSEIIGYMDGVEGSRFARPGPPPDTNPPRLDTTNDYGVGYRNDDNRMNGVEGNFNGKVDDVAVWNTALNPREIKALRYVGDTAALGHDAGEMQSLINLFGTGAGALNVDNIRWQYDANAGRFGGNPGDAFQSGSNYVLRLGAGAEGLVGTVIPEPGSLALAAGSLLFLARRRRKA